MGLVRDIVRIELTTRTAGPDDHVALPGMPLWVVGWTKRDRLGRERSWSAPNVTEAGARRMVTNLLAERVPELSVDEVFTDHVS